MQQFSATPSEITKQYKICFQVSRLAHKDFARIQKLSRDRDKYNWKT